AVLESHAAGVSLADQLGGTLRDHDVGAELLGLGVRASGQLLARNPGRKSKIVLDSRARSCLPSGRTGLEDQRVESLRGRVDGSCQTSRAGADDDDIALVSLVDPPIEAETVGNLLIAGVLQHGLATADHDR